MINIKQDNKEKKKYKSSSISILGQKITTNKHQRVNKFLYPHLKQTNNQS